MPGSGRHIFSSPFVLRSVCVPVSLSLCLSVCLAFALPCLPILQLFIPLSLSLSPSLSPALSPTLSLFLSLSRSVLHHLPVMTTPSLSLLKQLQWRNVTKALSVETRTDTSPFLLFLHTILCYTTPYPYPYHTMHSLQHVI